jgi:hypothetical protein
LRQRWFGQKKGASNLGSREAAERTQGKSDLRLAIECRVTAGEISRNRSSGSADGAGIGFS